ncbi:SPOR domain-containing protein [Fulvivirgaceae bacterium BMA10]|uniref:SPOR domain-containing protein n=1 Tax=Splendidivirga corallicola TaxID=3051826 RepID=A0ABT8KUA7_9BACT|nr:SPOR domain-containing protein [Fulvivirgaceae bacterium BMA10]
MASNMHDPGTNMGDEDYGLPEVNLKPIAGGGGAAKSASTTQKSSTQNKRYQGQSNAPIIVLLIFVFLAIVGILGWIYKDEVLAFFKSEPEVAQQEETPEETTQPGTETATLDTVNEASRRQQEELEAADESSSSTTGSFGNISASGVGQITELTGRTGRTYVIVGSFLDVDLAKDYGNKLAKEGLNTTIIPPYNKRKFYRLAIADYGSISEAVSELDGLRATYGNQIWVLKY